MFRAPPRASSGAYNCITASGFTLERGGSKVVGQRPTTLLPRRSKVKPEAVMQL